jgi:hypothetical protein
MRSGRLPETADRHLSQPAKDLLIMTDLAYSTNTSSLHVGDLIVLDQPVYLRAFHDTIPAGVLGTVQWIDDESSDLLVRLLNHFGWLHCWRNRIPVTTSQVSVVVSLGS